MNWRKDVFRLCVVLAVFSFALSKPVHSEVKPGVYACIVEHIVGIEKWKDGKTFTGKLKNYPDKFLLTITEMEKERERWDAVFCRLEGKEYSSNATCMASRKTRRRQDCDALVTNKRIALQAIRVERCLATYKAEFSPIIRGLSVLHSLKGPNSFLVFEGPSVGHFLFDRDLNFRAGMSYPNLRYTYAILGLCTPFKQ